MTSSKPCGYLRSLVELKAHGWAKLWRKTWLQYCILLLSAVGSGQGATREEPTVDLYGYLDLGPRYSDSPDSSRWSLDSRGSYIGVTGASNIDSAMRVLFQLEYEIYPDGGGEEAFQRNDVFLGLQTPAGVFRAGTMETPLRHLADPIDQFPDTSGDPSALWNGDLRTGNTLYYQTPVTTSLPLLYKAELAVVFFDESDDGLSDTNSDGYSAALWFGDENAGLAIATDRHIGDDAVARQRLVGYWSTSLLRVGAGVERESHVSDPSTLAKIASLAVNIGNVYLVKAQFGKSDMQRRSEYLFSVGVDAPLAENLTLYANLHDHRASNAPDTLSLESGLRFLF